MSEDDSYDELINEALSLGVSLEGEPMYAELEERVKEARKHSQSITPTFQNINDGNAWGIVLVPLVVIIAGLFSNANTIGLVVPIVLTYFDRKHLKENGIENPPSFWWFLIGMVYLWKRANLLNKNRLHAWIWLGSILVGGALEVVWGVE